MCLELFEMVTDEESADEEEDAHEECIGDVVTADGLVAEDAGGALTKCHGH